MPGTRYRVTHYIMSVVVLIMAAWFAYDGFHNWPKQKRENDANAEAGRPQLNKPHTDMDILIQRALAIGLPFIGIGLLARCLSQSRGTLRLEEDVLHVPGHPAVPVADIRSIDNESWEKKGIAVVSYETAGRRGTLKLDDYHYDRDPTDKIQKIITERLEPKKAVAAITAVQPPPRARSVRADTSKVPTQRPSDQPPGA